MWQLIAGPLLGLVGSGIEKWSEHKENLRADKRAEDDRQHELKVMQFELDNAVILKRLEGEENRMTIDQQVFGENLKVANKSLIPEGQNLEGWRLTAVVLIEVFCKSIRPTSTVFYQVFVAVIFGWAAYNAVNSGTALFTPKEYTEIVREVIYSVIGMAETTLLWWYGIRRMSKEKK